MKIEQSAIQLSAQHSAVRQSSRQESLTVWVGNQRPETQENDRPATAGSAPTDNVTLSSEGRQAASEANEAAALDSEQALEHDVRYQIIKRLVEIMTGKTINVTRLEPVESQPVDLAQPQPGQAVNDLSLQPAGFGLIYERRQTYYEAEQLSFSAQGLIKTSDGREIGFDLNLIMSREYYEESSTSLRLGDAVMKDPLVINFDAPAASLTSAKFNFDLNSDGQDDRISFVGRGSGFLALDLNNDGKINNGRELFGPATGNGFAELAVHDQDGNGWIDENDAVFDQLRIWTKDEQGRDTLHTLSEKNIGAIYLGNVATPFELKNDQNRLDGRVLTSSVYLKENGEVGTVQQIDLAV